MRGTSLYKTSIGVASMAMLVGTLFTAMPASASSPSAPVTAPIFTNTDSVSAYVWTGAGNTDTFSTAANWEGNSVPTQNNYMLVLPCYDSGSTLKTSLKNDLGIAYSGIALKTSESDCKSLTLDEITFSNDAVIQRTSNTNYYPRLTIGSVEGAADSIIITPSIEISKELTTKKIDIYGYGIPSNLKVTEELNLHDGAYLYLNAINDNVKITAEGKSSIYITGGDKKSNSITLNNNQLRVSRKGTWDCDSGTCVQTITDTDSELTGAITLTGNSTYSVDYLAKLTLSGTIDGEGFALTPTSESTGDFNNATKSDNSDTKKGLQEFVATTIDIAAECKKNVSQSGSTVTGTSTRTYFTISREQVGELTEEANCSYGSIDANGLLRGNGTVGSLYLTENGVVAPGNSPGKITVLETLSMVLGTTYQAEILNKDNYDQLVVGQDFEDESNSGAVAVNIDKSTLSLSLLDGYEVHKGDTFTIIDNKSETAVKGTFDGLEEGAEVIIEGAVFKISYVGGDGNDVVLTAQNDSISPNAPNTGAKEIATKPIMAAVAGIAAVALFALTSKRRAASRR